MSLCWPPRSGGLEGEFGAYPQAAMFGSFQAEAAVQGEHPFAHPGDAEMTGCGSAGAEAAAVVGDAQLQAIVRRLEAHRDRGGRCVAGDIGEALLQQAEQREGRLLVHWCIGASNRASRWISGWRAAHALQ